MRSLSAQASALTRYVYFRENWVLKDMYIEVGSAKPGSSRREFSRLIEDCKDHKIENIVVKSLSRFSRDTEEAIESIRTLVKAGVDVYLMDEDKRIDAAYPELELSIRACINQAENEQRSENIKMGLRFCAENGTSGLYRKPCYGYRKNDEGNLEIVDQEAYVVSKIYDMYLEGKSFSGIISGLAEEHIPSPRGSERWSKRGIETILTNVKYTGSVVVLKNSHNSNRYRMDDSHPAIISTDLFVTVQQEIERRAKRKPKDESVASRNIRELNW